MNQNKHIKRIFILALSAILMLACMCGPGTLLSSRSTEPPPKATEELVSPTQEETMEIEPTQTDESLSPTMEELPVAHLSADPPWLIISTDDGLYATNKDGIPLVRLTEKTYQDIDLRRSISSKAHKLAYLTSGENYFQDLALQIISVPDGAMTKEIKLTTVDTEPGTDAGPGEPAVEAVRAISEQPSYAWSPDGMKIAFTAALDKPEADIYVYDLSTEKITRISDDDGQDFAPAWSPDGKTILYLEAEGFGTGAGYAMKGFWTASADGSGAKMLEKVTSGGEDILGWRDNNTAVLASWDAWNGTNNLRLYNIKTKKQTVLIKGAVSGAAVATGIEGDYGSILYAGDDILFVLPQGSTSPKKLSSEKVSSYGYLTAIRWQEEGRIFIVHFDGGKIATFMNDGSERQDAPFNISTGSLDVSSFGLIWSWTDKGSENEGVWISGPGLTSKQILNGPAVHPNWNIDNDLLFFVDQDLYRATFARFYADASPITPLTGNVLDSAWMGFSEALDKKYGP